MRLSYHWIWDSIWKKRERTLHSLTEQHRTAVTHYSYIQLDLYSPEVHVCYSSPFCAISINHVHSNFWDQTEIRNTIKRRQTKLRLNFGNALYLSEIANITRDCIHLQLTWLRLLLFDYHLSVLTIFKKFFLNANQFCNRGSIERKKTNAIFFICDIKMAFFKNVISIQESSVKKKKGYQRYILCKLVFFYSSDVPKTVFLINATEMFSVSHLMIGFRLQDLNKLHLSSQLSWTKHVRVIKPFLANRKNSVFFGFYKNTWPLLWSISVNRQTPLIIFPWSGRIMHCLIRPGTFILASRINFDLMYCGECLSVQRQQHQSVAFLSRRPLPAPE